MVKICPSCKKFVPESAKSCPLCGSTKLLLANVPASSAATVAQAVVKPKKKKSKIPAIIRCLFLITAIVSATALITIKLTSNNEFELQKAVPDKVTEAKPDKKSTPAPKESQKLLPRSNCDFRNTKWGDSKETVKQYDDTIEIKEEAIDMIAGTDTVSGYDVLVGYTFDNNGKLFRGSYIFLWKQRDMWKFIATYNDLLEKLTKTYGQPDESAIIPLTMQDLIDMAGQETALKLGYVMYVSTWETTTTKIIIYLSTENYETTLGVVYQDLNYEDSIYGF